MSFHNDRRVLLELAGIYPMQTTYKSPTGCRPSQFTGPWAMEQQAYDDLYAVAEQIIASGQLEVVARQSAEQAKEREQAKPYAVENGIARFLVAGPMVRYPSSFGSAFGETATLPLQRAIRLAADDGFVSGAFFEIASPGGTVEGLSDLAAEVARFRARKPVRAHVSGMGTSAAYRLGIEADVLTADPMGIVGSVGTLTQMRDTSKLMERAGVTQHYIASGDRKAAGAPGTPVTPEQLAERKALVDQVNAAFLSSVRTRRGRINDEDFADVARAGLYGAVKAQQMGLVDAVCDTECAAEQFQQRIPFGQGRTLPAA